MRYDDELRAWAKGIYTSEAATELLIRAFGGSFALPGNPWIIKEKEEGNVWINFELIPEHLNRLSSGERSLLLIVASIAGVETNIVLGDAITGLDRKVLDLVLAAVAHAGGSHEPSDFITHADGTESRERPSSLHPWPDEA